MIQQVLINDYEEKYAPPEANVLSVSCVDNLVFLRIGSYEETHLESKFTVGENEDNRIAVPLVQLLNAIITCQNGEAEDDVRRAVDKARSQASREEFAPSDRTKDYV